MQAMSNEQAPGGFVVALAVTLDHDLGHDGALDVARAWAQGLGLAPGMTSWDGDRLALRVSGMATPGVHSRGLADEAEAHLWHVLRTAGATVVEQDSVEVLAPHVVEQRLARRALPPTVNAREFADLADVTPSRIRQLASQRRAGKRDDFPAELLEGHWLRSEAEHWARTRRTRPGPAPGSPAARTPRDGEVAEAVAEEVAEVSDSEALRRRGQLRQVDPAAARPMHPATRELLGGKFL